MAHSSSHRTTKSPPSRRTSAPPSPTARPKTPKPPKAPLSKTTEFPPAFIQEREQLRVFLQYFPSTARNAISNGCNAPRYYGILFHPDFGAAARRATVWVERFWPPKEQQAERRRAAIPTTGPAYRAWHTKALRRRVERILGNLVIPTDTEGGSDWVLYASAQPGYLPNDPEPMTDERRAALRDPDNYTFFRRPNHNVKALNRLLVPPPLWEDYAPNEPGLPSEISAMYRAWSTLYYRAVTPFDPVEVGLEWTDTGLIFVNWKRFLTSPFGPPSLPDPHHVAGILRGGRQRGGYRLKLSAFPPPEKFKNLTMSTRIVSLGPTGDYEDPCSLLDPLYLVSRSDLFDPDFHRKREEYLRRATQRVQERASQDAALRDQGLIAPRTTKVYPFPYKPVEHVPTAFRRFEKPLSFSPEQREIAYAIKYRGDLYFRPPTLVPLTKTSPPAEIEAWRSAMLTFKFIEHFTEHGGIGDIEPQSFHELTRELTEKELAETAKKEIESFVSLEDLSKAEVKRLRQLTSRRYGEDPESAADGRRWYYDKVLAHAHRTLPLSAVRRTARVIIPEELDPKTNQPRPIQAKFFSRRALKKVQQLSKDAPYLYAWATFCLKAHAVGTAFAAKDDAPAAAARWQPREDLVLMEMYRAHPRMDRKEKTLLLKQLPRYSWEACVRRVRQLNKTLASICTPAQMQRYTVGKFWFPDAVTPVDRMRMVRRVLVMVGIASYRRYLKEPLHQNIHGTAGVFQIDGEVLDTLELPNTYRTDYFERLAKVARASGD